MKRLLSLLALLIALPLAADEPFTFKVIGIDCAACAPPIVKATNEFQAAALPYIRVYDAKGRFVAAVTGSMWDEVLATIEKAEARR